jgi:hypothetical protein
MYDFTLVNLSIFYGKLYGQKYVVTPIYNLFWLNLDIIEIIMWQDLEIFILKKQLVHNFFIVNMLYDIKPFINIFVN